MTKVRPKGDRDGDPLGPATKRFNLVFIIGLSCNDVKHTNDGDRKEDQDRGLVKEHCKQLPQD